MNFSLALNLAHRVKRHLEVPEVAPQFPTMHPSSQTCSKRHLMRRGGAVVLSQAPWYGSKGMQIGRSGWESIGRVRHVDQPTSVQVKEEVIPNEGPFRQTSEPYPIRVNGEQKIIGGVPFYYVDCVELALPLK